MKVLLVVLLLVPQLAMARMYMCTDPQTGQTTFSDRGCKTVAEQEEIRVEATNVNSGRRTAEAPPPRTWVSDRDSRKSGVDYAAQQRSLLDRDATAAIDPVEGR